MTDQAHGAVLQQRSDPAPSEHGAPPGATAPSHIAVVSQDATVALLTAEWLAVPDIRPHIVATGRELTTRAQAGEFAVVLLDLVVPGETVMELLTRLRLTPAGRQVCALVIGTARTDGLPAAALEAGADGYLIRPMSPRLLRATVRAALRRAASSVSSC